MTINSSNQNFIDSEKLLNIQSGLSYLSQISRAFLKKAAPEYYNKLEQNQKLFTSPCLFSVASKICPSYYLKQSIIGALPYNNIRNLRNIPLFSENSGNIYIPLLGYKTGMSGKQKHTVDGSFFHPKDWLPEIIIHNKIVVQRAPNIFLEEVFAGHKVSISFNEEILQKLVLSLDIIKEVSPVYYDALTSVTQSIVPFTSRDLNSFATTTAFGSVFINTYRGRSLPFFIEDLAHQCGHLVFTSLTADPRPLFSISPSTSISEVVEDSSDQRSLYVLLHGLYTYSSISMCLSKSIEFHVLNNIEHHEALGRLAFALQRFQSDLLLSCKLSVLTEVGKQWVSTFANCYRQVCTQHAEKVKHLKMHDQPYNFSIEAFLEHNKID